jgi:hypothetical protein
LFDFTALEITVVLREQGHPGQGDKSKTVADFFVFRLPFDFSTWIEKSL